MLTLSSDVEPGAVKRRKEKEKEEREAKEAEAKRIEDERRAQEEKRRKAEAEAREAAEKLKKQREADQLATEEAEARKEQIASTRILFTCKESGGDAGFLIEIPPLARVGQLARTLVDTLGYSIAMKYGEEGRNVRPKISLDESGIRNSSTVLYFKEEGEEERIECDEAGHPSVKVMPFSDGEEAKRIEGRLRAEKYIGTFAQTSGWPLPPPQEELEQLRVLLPLQLRGLEHVRKQCRPHHENALEIQEKRAVKLGFDDLAFVRALEWVRELAPLIVHVDLAEFGKPISKDTHYRNQFETGKSRGGLNYSRMVSVENTMYGNHYDGCKAEERIKYGVLNFANNVKGVLSCKMYGQDYFKLKKVRLRTTMCSNDTWCNTDLGTPDYYAHILGAFNDNDFEAAIKLANARGKNVSEHTNEDGPYKEVQIHGDICLKEHIDSIVVSDHHQKTEKFMSMLEELSKACNNCPVLWMANKEDHERITEIPKSRRELQYEAEDAES